MLALTIDYSCSRDPINSGDGDVKLWGGGDYRALTVHGLSFI